MNPRESIIKKRLKELQELKRRSLEDELNLKDKTVISEDFEVLYQRYREIIELEEDYIDIPFIFYIANDDNIETFVTAGGLEVDSMYIEEDY